MNKLLLFLLSYSATNILAGCSSGASGPRQMSLVEAQISEARDALSKGQITMAEYLSLKQKAEQAEAQRDTIMRTSP